ncbi:hypothetical protein OAS64_02410 [Candidatus Pelagibacter sp.]|nr:hypothetical protein [Candidatus Pelagibacter sp.]
MKNNTKHIIFNNFIKYLYKKKIKYCVLTIGKNFPLQIIRDIDFYINLSNKSELINLVNIFCNKNYQNPVLKKDYTKEFELD